MSRLRILSLLLVVLCSGLLSACSEQQEREQIAQTLERAARATKGLGMHVTMAGLVSVDGQSQQLSARSTIAAGGRRARISTRVAGTTIEQYVDGHFMLMRVGAIPGAAAQFPAGTRYLRLDLDRLLKSAGADATMQQLSSVDPAATAALLSDVADVKSVGRDAVRGTPVTRYSATVNMHKLLEAVLKNADLSGMPREMADADLLLEVAIDGEDRIRAFGMSGDIGPVHMSMNSEVTSFTRGLQVPIPANGVVDYTDEVLAAVPRPARQP